MDSCLFCKIANQSLPSKVVLQDEQVFAFEDIDPQAPTHILIIPKKHIATLNDVYGEDVDILGRMVVAAVDIARDRKISSSGYRLVFNTNPGAGQSIFHIHLHLLGGRRMAWPPG